MKLILPSLIACLFTSDLVVAQSSEKDLVGVWEVKVTPRDAPGAFFGIDMFSADGNFIHNVDEALPPIPPVQSIGTKRSSGFGRWKRKSEKDFTLTFYTVLWKEGVVNRFLRVQRTLTLSDSGDEFSGPAMADFCDANWNIVFSTTTDVKGKMLETP